MKDIGVRRRGRGAGILANLSKKRRNPCFPAVFPNRSIRFRALGQSVESLSTEERLEYYRFMAAHSLHMAQLCADDESRAHYIDGAARWSALATEVQRQMERADGNIPAMLQDNKSSYSRARR